MFKESFGTWPQPNRLPDNIPSFVHLSINHICISAYSVTGIVLGSKDRKINNTQNCLQGSYGLVGETGMQN